MKLLLSCSSSKHNYVINSICIPPFGRVLLFGGRFGGTGEGDSLVSASLSSGGTETPRRGIVPVAASLSDSNTRLTPIFISNSPLIRLKSTFSGISGAPSVQLSGGGKMCSEVVVSGLLFSSVSWADGKTGWCSTRDR